MEIQRNEERGEEGGCWIAGAVINGFFCFITGTGNYWVKEPARMENEWRHFVWTYSTEIQLIWDPVHTRPSSYEIQFKWDTVQTAASQRASLHCNTNGLNIRSEELSNTEPEFIKSIFQLRGHTSGQRSTSWTGVKLVDRGQHHGQRSH